jgi:hypothetical protein
MRKSATTFKSNTIHIQRTVHVPPILSRKGRRIWAGAQNPPEEGGRMRCELAGDSYETWLLELPVVESPAAEEVRSERFAVKPDLQTAE